MIEYLGTHGGAMTVARQVTQRTRNRQRVRLGRRVQGTYVSENLFGREVAYYLIGDADKSMGPG